VLLIVLTVLIGDSEVIVADMIDVVGVEVKLVMLLKSSCSESLKKTEIDVMKMAETIKKSFIYSELGEQEKIGEDWRRNCLHEDWKGLLVALKLRTIESFLFGGVEYDDPLLIKE